jgi:hypothetical protein
MYFTVKGPILIDCDGYYQMKLSILFSSWIHLPVCFCFQAASSFCNGTKINPGDKGFIIREKNISDFCEILLSVTVAIQVHSLH